MQRCIYILSMNNSENIFTILDLKHFFVVIICVVSLVTKLVSSFALGPLTLSMIYV